MLKILSNKKEIISYVFVLSLGLLISAMAASASTTISTDIVTGGSLGVASSTPGYPLSIGGSGFFDGGTVTAKNFLATSTITVQGTSSFTGLATFVNATTTGPVTVGGDLMVNGYATTTATNGNIATQGTLAVTGASTLTGKVTFAYASSTGSISQSAVGTSTLYMLSSTPGKGFCMQFNATSSATVLNMTFLASSTASVTNIFYAGVVPVIAYGACN